MIELVMLKGLDGQLIPATAEDADKLATLKAGTPVKVALTGFHNTLFHRKLMALFRLGFEAFEDAQTPPLVYRGKEIAKSFEGFRKDLTILSGHYNAYHRLNGEVRFEAKSLSFRRMSDDVKVQVYRDVLGQCWQRVMTHRGYRSPEQVDETVEKLLRME